MPIPTVGLIQHHLSMVIGSALLGEEAAGAWSWSPTFGVKIQISAATSPLLLASSWLEQGHIYVCIKTAYFSDIWICLVSVIETYLQPVQNPIIYTPICTIYSYAYVCKAASCPGIWSFPSRSVTTYKNTIRHSITQYLFCIHWYVCQGDMFRPSRSSSGPPRKQIQLLDLFSRRAWEWLKRSKHVALTYIPVYIN